VSLCNLLDIFGLCFPGREGCRSLYYVIGNYHLLLVANMVFLYLGVKRAEQQRALNDNRQ